MTPANDNGGLNVAAIRKQILRIAKLRAYNSIAAWRSRFDTAVLRSRTIADRAWGQHMLDLANQLPKDDTLRDVVWTLANLDAQSPPAHLSGCA